MRIRHDWAKGAFGDGKVLLCSMERDAEENAPVVVLLHGVHGSANGMRENKYGYLARLMARNGYVAWTVETSRTMRNRELLGRSYTGWAGAAFAGKTFAMEVLDACWAVASIGRRYPRRPMVLWGFSLGGLIALFLAGRGNNVPLPEREEEAPAPVPIRGLVLSGCGDGLRPEGEESLHLPVLDTIWSREELYRAAAAASPEFALFFYGSRDETFSEESSRRLLNGLSIPEDRKDFQVIPEASHAFRELRGRPSKGALREMVSVTTATLRRFL